MPIEIKELVIRTIVDSGRGAESAGAHGGGTSADAATTEEIVQECVRQVLRVLKVGRER